MEPKKMKLGEIVREIVTNSRSIQCLVGGGVGDPSYSANTPLRHETEQRQEQLYGELERRKL